MSDGIRDGNIEGYLLVEWKFGAETRIYVSSSGLLSDGSRECKIELSLLGEYFLRTNQELM